MPYAPGPYAPGPYAPPPKQKKGRGCLIATLIAVGLIVIIVIALVASAGNRSGGTGSAGGSGQNTGGDPAAKYLNYGETYKIGDWEITVNSVEIVSEVQKIFGTYEPEEGSKCIVAELTVKNVGKEMNTFLPYFGTSNDLSVSIQIGSYTFKAVDPITLLSDDNLQATKLNPLESSTGIIVFSVAEEALESADDIILTFSLKRESLSFLIMV